MIRNFVIISHIDHGKSTLSDRFLEITKTVPKEKMENQYLDMMDLEKERGITIKMQPCRMNYTIGDKSYILNLIDTPGHVDFSYEVSRALAAVEGAILLVDAVKGIQAQTLANLDFAKKQNLVIIPAVNKIDAINARVEEAKKEIAQVLGISADDVFEISAKQGTNVEELLKAVIEKVPAPARDSEDAREPLKALIFDSKYDSFKGVVAFVRIFQGEIKQNEKIYLINARIDGEAKDVGVFTPQMVSTKQLKCGEIGYIATGVKEPGQVRIGDYPEDSDNFELLKQALLKLKLSDPSLYFEQERKEILGQGFRCGFLGSLHLEIAVERLRREFGLELVVFSPTVVYKSFGKDGKEILIFTPSDWDNIYNKEVQEPWVKLEIIVQASYLSGVMDIIKDIDGEYITTDYFGKEKLLLKYEIPLREIVAQFYNKLMSKTQGYASINYEILGYRKANLEKLEVLIAGKKEEAFSKIVPARKAEHEARILAKKIKDVLPTQQFSVPIQVAIGGNIIARETIKARRKDVTAPLYGGDVTRKRKLLEKQKKGKKKLRQTGNIKIPSKAFLEVSKI
jgi:GTP-binding protein LepA